MASPVRAIRIPGQPQLLSGVERTIGTVLVVAVVGLLLLRGRGFFFILLPSSVVLPLLATFLPGGVCLGTDGVLVSWLWSTRFVAFRDVEGCTVDTSARRTEVVLRVRGGANLLICMDDGRGDSATRKERADLSAEIDRRVREAVGRAPESTRAALALTVAGAAERGQSAGDESAYRSNRIDRDGLLRIAADGVEHPRERVTALALLFAKEPEIARRIAQEGIDDSASPETRAAFEASLRAENSGEILEIANDIR